MNSLQANSNKKFHWLAFLVISAIVLIGYNKLFAGANFYFYEDPVSASDYTYGITQGNGWRADKGLGITSFYGGPGPWHPWSLLTFWDRLMPAQALSFSTSILILSIISGMATYFLLFNVLPKDHRWLAVILAPLIIFSSQFGSNYGLRGWITMWVGEPLIILLLYRFYTQPRKVHYFCAALLFWFVAGLGNLWSLTQVMSVGVFFTALYAFYFRREKRPVLWKFFSIYAFAGVCFLLLSSYAMYGFVDEAVNTGYMREKSNDIPTALNFAPNVRKIVNFVMGSVQVEWLPLINDYAGIGFTPLSYSYNAVAIFPLVFLFFLFRRAENFWEFSLKALIVTFFVYKAITVFIPPAGAWYSYLNSRSSKLLTMFGPLYSAQIALIALFIIRMGKEDFILKNKIGRLLQCALATVLSCVYAGIFIVSLMAFFVPQSLNALVDVFTGFLPAKIGSHPVELINAVLHYNVDRFVENTHWYSVLFYLTSVILVGAFIKNKWLHAISQKSKVVIATVVLSNAIMFCWTLYPLNTNQLVWDREDIKALEFQPTDRFYYVKNNTSKQTLESFKKKYLDLEGGHREELLGLVSPPGLNLSGLKSFDSKQNGEFIYHIFNGDGKQRLKDLRLYYGKKPRYSDLIDMLAVNYYYSDYELPDPPAHIQLIHTSKQLFIYKNLSAWPYFYLAKQFGLKKSDEHLTNVVRDTAYVEQAEMFELPDQAGEAKIELTSFIHGDMTFDYESQNDEFLVVADSWHPKWKASISGREVPIVKTNEVFKGVRLPAGRNQLRLYFDTSGYLPGAYIAIASWILFFIGWAWAAKEPQPVQSVTQDSNKELDQNEEVDYHRV